MAETTTLSKQKKTKAPARGANNKDGEMTRPTARKRRSARVQAEISVIVPIYNMAGSVESMHRGLITALQDYGKPYEIVFVDDASTDGTWNQLEALATADKHITLIRMRNTFGEASAFDAGLKHVKGSCIVYAAARINANWAELAKLLRKLDAGYDLVVAHRWPRKDSKLNQTVSRWFNKIVQKLGKVDLHDINSSIFVTRKDVLDAITIYGDLNIFIPILAAGKGFKITEEKIEQMPGEFRQSRYIMEYIQRVLDIVTVIFLTKYSKKPLHFLGFAGMLFTVAGAGMSGYLFFYRLFGFGAIAGRPLLLLGVLLLVIGLQMISIGLIGEMIIFTHAREIKEYNIEMVIGE